MKEGQEAIYYISGESHDALRTSPQLEQALAKGVEVLLLDDPVDEFWMPEVKDYQGKQLRSLTRGDVDLSAVKGEAEPARAEEALGDVELKRLIARLKVALGEEVTDVRARKRLRDSAVCLVAEDHGLDLRLERFLKQHSQLDKLSKRVLEINGQHELTRRMAEHGDGRDRRPASSTSWPGCCSTRRGSSRASRSRIPARSRGGCRASWRRDSPPRGRPPRSWSSRSRCGASWPGSRPIPRACSGRPSWSGCSGRSRPA